MSKKKITCPTCNGLCVKRVKTKTVDTWITCPQCDGEGKVEIGGDE